MHVSRTGETTKSISPTFANLEAQNLLIPIEELILARPTDIAIAKEAFVLAVSAKLLKLMPHRIIDEEAPSVALSGLFPKWALQMRSVFSSRLFLATDGALIRQAFPSEGKPAI